MMDELSKSLYWTVGSYDESLFDFYEIAKARYEVFVMEQEIICEQDLDDRDQECIHIYLRDGDEKEVLAYCRVVPAGVGYDKPSIGRVLVKKSHRGKAIAQEMIQLAIDYIVDEMDEDEIIVSAQSYVKGLYESVGFEIISDEYIEAGIPHYKMIWKDK